MSTSPTSITMDPQGDLVIVREFNAPRPLVFEAWTRPEHFARWFGPHGFTLSHLVMEARPGGRLNFCHRTPESIRIGPDNVQEVWIRGTFLEIAAPERLVLAFGFSDPEGNIVERPGFALESRVAVTLEETATGTRLTIRHSGLPADQGEGEGWAQGLERLADVLSQGLHSS